MAGVPEASSTDGAGGGDRHSRQAAWAQASGRSYSAPPRKKWYRRGPLRRMSSQQSMLYDRVVSRRLVGAIAAWHDLHSTLLQLSADRKAIDSGTASGHVADCDTPETSTTPSDDAQVYSSEDSCVLSDGDKGQSPSQSDYDSEISDSEPCSDVDDDLIEATGALRETRSTLNGKLSLSNPELTSVQLKNMFPELSEHWSSFFVSVLAATS
uniref:Uncharacterized protein n=1 Tax=Panagrellus redivivus TaxID=6233 RepID=A0A7E4V553_PANRE